MPSLIINNAPPSPGLLDQPNEVLHMIVSYLPDRSFIKFTDEDGVRRRVHQYLVVAQACQRLRTVVLQADFWLDPKFHFSCIVHGKARFLGLSTVADEILEGGLLRALLGDDNFVRCLSRKTEWTFWSLGTLLTVVLSGSWFSQSTELVYLYGHMHVNTALRSLSSCGQLRCLILDCLSLPRSTVDLSLISTFLPNLTQLHLLHILSFEGSLAKARNLTDLTVYIDTNRQADFDTLLPLASSSTLRKINYRRIPRLSSSLNSLSKLTHLRLPPLSEEIVAGLRNLTNVQLHSLGVEVHTGRQMKHLKNLWHAESLKNLKQLDVSIDCREDEVETSSVTELMSRFVISFGIPYLETLEHLELCGGFDVAWGPRLASLKNLKCLHLRIPEGSLGCTIKGRFHDQRTFVNSEGLAACFDMWTKPEGLAAILEKEFESPPIIAVSFLDARWDYDVEAKALLMKGWSCLCGE